MRWGERWVREVGEEEKTRRGLVGMYKSYLDDVKALTLGARLLTSVPFRSSCGVELGLGLSWSTGRSVARKQ